MIWLTWRQFRLQALVIVAAVAVFAVLLAVTGPGLLNDWQAQHESFLSRIKFDRINEYLYIAGQALVYAAPPVIGAFWGAPLIARELEAGTHRLVWNQSIGRTRWLVTKLAVTGLAAIAVTGLLSLAVSWWSNPIDDAIDGGQTAGIYNLPRIMPAVFGARGVVPIGYAAFAFALGVAVGLATRRSVVAIAITLTVVIAAMILSPIFLRPHLMTPAEASVIVTADNMRGLQLSGPEENPEVMRIEAALEGSGFWKISEVTVNAAGQVQKTLPSWMAGCGPGRPNAPAAEAAARPPLSECFQRLADEGYRQQIKYYPADRFWALQWRETGIFLGLALGLTGFCFWRIRRDLT
ncbi:ABC-2 family transporter [Kribbella sp. VKM Ac-2527]|uniref:ABC-2 family transporter n=1 Tax=Kribbella caucasensis TaxID=2512215 RepID=A0A4R6KEI6_9ACTN|nr:ABC transporter permease subunit [Kribbella sp. VKM Ac-2527]TDO49049.1 ABC-2 family transporter [Kribbella sp. VKM Ac-2527]